MPGIFGLVRKQGVDRDANQALLDGMKARLSHNPDYQADAFVCDWCALGNIGLPPIGESNFYVDPNQSEVAAAYSGYLYAWRDLGFDLTTNPGDKAVQLWQVYKKYGRGLPEKIDGSYNATVVDLARKEVIICNDRFGYRQLYHYEDEDVFLFSTELKAFLAYDKFDRTLDLRATSDFFNYTYCLGTRTFFKNAHRLRASHVIAVSPNATEFHKYWEFHFDNESNQSHSELIDEVDSILSDIIRQRIGNAENIILPLSGGLDSRLIAAHAVRLGHEPHGFTQGIPNCLEHRIAKQVADTLRLRHHSLIELDPAWLVTSCEKFVKLTEGMVQAGAAVLLDANRSYNFPTERTVLLNGMNTIVLCDRFCQNLPNSNNLTYSDKLQDLRLSLFGGFVNDKYYQIYSEEFREVIKRNYMRNLDEEFRGCLEISDNYQDQKEAFFRANRQRTYLMLVDTNRFYWHDHLAMTADRLADFHQKFPAKLKLSQAFFFDYFKAKFPALAHIPYHATGVNLYQKPSPYRRRMKVRVNRLKYLTGRLSMGKLNFFNMNNWFHHDQWYRAHRPLRDFYESILLDERTISRGYFDRANITKLLRRQRRGGNSFFDLAHLVSFEMFHRLFVDR